MGRIVGSLLVTLLCFAVTCADAQDDPAAVIEKADEQEESVDPTGTWTVQPTKKVAGMIRSIDPNLGSDVSMYLELRLGDYDQVTGRVYFGEYLSFEVSDGRLSGSQLKFNVDGEVKGNVAVEERNFETDVRAVIDGDSMYCSGTMFVGYDQIDIQWSAKRDLLMEDFLGTWDLQIGSRNTITLRINKDGEKLTGEYTTPTGERTEIMNLEVKDNQLTFQSKVMRGDQEVTLTFTGQTIGNRIEKGVLDLNGQSQVEFSGKRQPAEVPAE